MLGGILDSITLEKIYKNILNYCIFKIISVPLQKFNKHY